MSLFHRCEKEMTFYGGNNEDIRMYSVKNEKSIIPYISSTLLLKSKFKILPKLSQILPIVNEILHSHDHILLGQYYLPS